jgi:tRNA A58 N-methylase Trm61
MLAINNGTPSRTAKLCDISTFWDPVISYEEDFLQLLRDTELENKSIVEVGGGFGVCTAEIATRARPDGEVVTHEAKDERCVILHDTLQMNHVADMVDVRNQRVESVSEDCDVLVLDCEGSEREILGADYYGDPDTVIVETHPVFGAPTTQIKRELEVDGYQILTEWRNGDEPGFLKAQRQQEESR